MKTITAGEAKELYREWNRKISSKNKKSKRKWKKFNRCMNKQAAKIINKRIEDKARNGHTSYTTNLNRVLIRYYSKKGFRVNVPKSWSSRTSRNSRYIIIWR